MPLYPFREINWQKSPLLLVGDWGKGVAEPGPGQEEEARAREKHHRPLQWLLVFHWLQWAMCEHQGVQRDQRGKGHPPGTRKSMTALEHMWRFPSRFAALRKGKFWGTEPWLGTLFMLPWSDAHWFRNLLKATCKIKAFLCSLFGPKTVSFSKMLHIPAAFANGRNDASLLKR